jgi:hypothetical protein
MNFACSARQLGTELASDGALARCVDADEDDLAAPWRLGAPTRASSIVTSRDALVEADEVEELTIAAKKSANAAATLAIRTRTPALASPQAAAVLLELRRSSCSSRPRPRSPLPAAFRAAC